MIATHKLLIIITTCLLFFLTHNLYLKSRLDQLEILANQNFGPASRTGGGQPSSQVVLYNRVPKTGSTSLMNIAYELYKHNNFRVVGLKVVQYKHTLTTADQASLVANMSQQQLPALFHGHFAYFNPGRLGSSLSPVYINLVRAPLDRLVSHYYFLRYGDDVLVNKVRAKEGDTTTFDACVAAGGPDCDPRKLWLQVPFFCGSAPQCWDPGSEWALATAKRNLASQYLVVGVTEEMDSFVQVLEQLLPDFFSGAVDFLAQSGQAHIKHTRHKDPLSQETIAKMKSNKIWKMENDFYNFALRTFHSIMESTLEGKKTKGRFFKFEKVKPKF